MNRKLSGLLVVLIALTSQGVKSEELSSDGIKSALIGNKFTGKGQNDQPTWEEFKSDGKLEIATGSRNFSGVYRVTDDGQICINMMNRGENCWTVTADGQKYTLRSGSKTKVITRR